MSTATSAPLSVETLEILREIEIAAPVEIAFQALLEELGPEATMMNGQKMPFKLEAWPGGRWFRDLGSNNGHLWGHVQVIKAPTLLEIWGPMMMSFPSVNHLQYRLTAQAGGTKLAFTHRAMGFILSEHREGMPQGWTYWIDKIRQRAESQATQGEK